MDLSTLPIIDAHAHPLVVEGGAPDTADLIRPLTEARREAQAEAASCVSVGAAIRELAGFFGVSSDVGAVVTAARAAREGDEGRADLTRRILAQARIEALVIDDGYPPANALPLDLPAMGEECGDVAIHRALRIERVAERLIAKEKTFDGFRHALQKELTGLRDRGIVSLKSIIGYRGGLEVEPRADIDAAKTAFEDRPKRLDGLAARPLLDWLFHEALAACAREDVPLQIHAGFGDRDIDLRTADPSALKPLLDTGAAADARIVILHAAYPHVAQAAWLATVFEEVWVDFSLVTLQLGPILENVLQTLLAGAPARKVVYGSDASLLPEAFWVAAAQTRRALGHVLDGWIDRGVLDREAARALAEDLLAGNARRLYGI